MGEQQEAWRNIAGRVLPARLWRWVVGVMAVLGFGDTIAARLGPAAANWWTKSTSWTPARPWIWGVLTLAVLLLLTLHGAVGEIRRRGRAYEGLIADLLARYESQDSKEAQTAKRLGEHHRECGRLGNAQSPASVLRYLYDSHPDSFTVDMIAEWVAFPNIPPYLMGGEEKADLARWFLKMLARESDPVIEEIPGSDGMRWRLTPNGKAVGRWMEEKTNEALRAGGWIR